MSRSGRRGVQGWEEDYEEGWEKWEKGRSVRRDWSLEEWEKREE